jgi:hypothetical protein
MTATTTATPTAPSTDGWWANRQRAPKAIKRTPEQAKAALAEVYARMDAEREAARAARREELAAGPVPAGAMWVYDTETGEKVGWLSDAGLVRVAPVAEAPAEETPAEETTEAPAPLVVVIPCGARKAPGVVPAGDKYTGPYATSARKAAQRLATDTGARVLILSALHGLLDLDTPVDDYDLVMGQAGCVTPARVAEQAAALGIDRAAVTVIAGRMYADVVTTVWPAAVRPLEGCTSFGAQRARMGAIARGEYPLEPAIAG